MKKSSLFIIIPLMLGISCFIAFFLIGSHITEDGQLVEPFALIPLGFLMIVISIIASLTQIIKFVFKKNKNI